MLWALLLAGGGLLIAGPVGAIIGLLIGVVLAIVSSGNNTRRLERQIRALHQGGESTSAPPAEKTFWTPSNIAILIFALVVGFIANEAKKEGPTTASPAIATAATAASDDIYIPRDATSDVGASGAPSAPVHYSAAAADAARAAEAASRSGVAAAGATQAPEAASDSGTVAEPAIRLPTE